jgi:quercetin dioxygenase-like cupin family protein
MKFRIVPLLLAAFAFTLVAQTASTPAVPISKEPHHHLAIENEYVRAYQVQVAAHEQTLMHQHDLDYAFVTLGATEVENDVAGKPPVQLKLSDGEVRFTPGNFAHIAKNLTGRPFRNVTVEFLKPSSTKWDEDRGVHVLQSGTQEILFVKNGMRASLIELQPGGMIPTHHHNGPHLMVAVSDLELRSDVEGQGSMPGHFKSGDVKWLPGGYTHTLTNVGKQPAKLVTFEF